MVEGKIVDAIEDGRIVRVTEEYAKREGLFILQKNPEQSFLPSQSQKAKRPEPAPFEPYRRSLRKNNVASSLKDNFHWIISARRKEKRLTRKQLAEALSENEYYLKVLENGIVPSDDFILISKVEKFLGINLRKDPNTSALPIQRPRYDERIREKISRENGPKERMTGSEIEIVED